MLLPVFNSEICIFDFDECNTYLGKHKTDEVLNALFNLPEVTGIENVPDAYGARALSTVHVHEKYPLPELLNFKKNPLGDWILRRIFESASLLGFDKTRDIKKLKYHRTWANKMEKGCNALAHRHAGVDWPIPHMVAIYYTEVPDDSADLVFIDDDDFNVMRGLGLSEYDEAKRHKVKSKEGRLICHDAKSFHATTIHNNELPRTCLIIEIGFPALT
jgi:hypothetical protein